MHSLELINKYNFFYSEVNDLVCVYETFYRKISCQDFLKFLILYIHILISLFHYNFFYNIFELIAGKT